MLFSKDDKWLKYRYRTDYTTHTVLSHQGKYSAVFTLVQSCHHLWFLSTKMIPGALQAVNQDLE